MPPALLPPPEHDEVHVSITFTWDREYGKFLREQWRGATDKPVLIGNQTEAQIRYYPYSLSERERNVNENSQVRSRKF
jgi:hypothetical protein